MQKRPTLDAFLTKSDLASTRIAANSNQDCTLAWYLPAEQQSLQDGPPGQQCMPADAEQRAATRVAIMKQGNKQLTAISSQQYRQKFGGMQPHAACSMVQATPAAPPLVPVLVVLTPDVHMLTASPTPEQLPIGKRQSRCCTASQQHQQGHDTLPEQQGALQQRSTAARYAAPLTPVPAKARQHRRQQQQQQQQQQKPVQDKRQVGALPELRQESGLLQLRSKLGDKAAGGARLPPALRRVCKNSLTLMLPGQSAVDEFTAKPEQPQQQKQPRAKRSFQQLLAEQEQQQPQVQQKAAQQQQQQQLQPQSKHHRVTWTPGDCTPKSAAAVAGAAATGAMIQPDTSAVPVASLTSTLFNTPAAPAAADPKPAHTTVSVVDATPLTDQARPHAALTLIGTIGTMAAAIDAEVAPQIATAAAGGGAPDVVEATPLTELAAAAATTAVVSAARRSGAAAVGTKDSVIAATPCSAVLYDAAAFASIKSAAAASAAKPWQLSTAATSWGAPPPSRAVVHCAAAAAAAAAASGKENNLPLAADVGGKQPAACRSSEAVLRVTPSTGCHWPSSRGQRLREMQLELEQQQLAAAGSADLSASSAAPALVATAALTTAGAAGSSASCKPVACSRREECLAAPGAAAAAAEDSSAIAAGSAADTCTAAAAAVRAVRESSPLVTAVEPGRAAEGSHTPVATHSVDINEVSLAAATCDASASIASLTSSGLQGVTQEVGMTQMTTPVAGGGQVRSLGPLSVAAATCGTPASAAAAAEAGLTPAATQDMMHVTVAPAAAAAVLAEAPAAAAATAVVQTPAAAALSAEADPPRHSPLLDASQYSAPAVFSFTAATCGTSAAAVAAASQGQVMWTPPASQDRTQLGRETQNCMMQVSLAGATLGTQCTPAAVASAAAAYKDAQCEQPAGTLAARSCASAAVTDASGARAAVQDSPVLSTQEFCPGGLSLVAVQGTAPDECQDAVDALTQGGQPLDTCHMQNEQPQQRERLQTPASSIVQPSDDKLQLQKQEQHQQQQEAAGAINGLPPRLQTQQQQQQEEEGQIQQASGCSNSAEAAATPQKQQNQAAQQHQPVDSTLTTTPTARSGLEQQQQQHMGQRHSSFMCASPMFSLTFIEAALQYAEQLQQEPMVVCSHWKGPRPAQQQQQQQQDGQKVQQQQEQQRQQQQQQQQSHQQGGMHQRQQQQHAQLPPLPPVLQLRTGQRQGHHAQPQRQQQHFVQQLPGQQLPGQQQLGQLQQQQQAKEVQPYLQPQNTAQPQPELQQQQSIQPGLHPFFGLPLQHTPHQQQQQQQQQQRESLDPLSCLRQLDLSQLLTQTPRTQAALLCASQTQNPLEVTPEVSDLSFHDRGVPPYVLVCESFPFQKDAIAFAAWCNLVGPVAVAALQRDCRAHNFRSFPDRQQFLQQWMQQHQPTKGMRHQQHQQDRTQQVQQQPEQQAQLQQDSTAAQAMISDTDKGTAAAATNSSSCLLGESSMAAKGPPPAAVHGYGADSAAATSAAAAGGGDGGGVGVKDAITASGSSHGSRTGSWELPWVRVFTEEYEGRNGYTRRFLAASYSALWRRHINTPVGRRHFYEVLQFGCPCHLYFDLEYSIAANPGVCGDELVNILVRLVREEFQRQWGIDIRKQWVVELDSSTSEKFSRHLIIRVPGWAFRDNAQVGALIRLITSRKEAVERLFLYKEPKQQQQQANGQAAAACRGVRVCFVDGAVYSKNRHFRLLGSSKGGKRAVLEPTLRYAMSAASRNALPVRPYQLFLMSLICNVHPDSQFLDVMPPLPPIAAPLRQQQQQGGALAAAAAVSGTDDEVLVQYPVRPGAGPIVLGNEVPIGQANAYRTIKATWGPMAQQQQGQERLPGTAAAAAGGVGGGAAAAAVNSSDSGFLDPALLQEVVLSSVGFLEEEAMRRAGGAPAQVRTIAYCGHTAPCQRHAAFAFSLIGPGSHMCANIGRNHKHNHVFFIVDFANGTFSQKCHDPDCWGYRSPWRQLPPHVWQKERLLGAANGHGSQWQEQ